MVASRVAPHPISSGLSVRALPETSFDQLSKVCDFWLLKGAGYDGPASRCLFELGHEIKALLQPLQQEEYRRKRRVQHLEQMMLQWIEVFGDSDGESLRTGEEKIRSPLAMMQMLQAQARQIQDLTDQLEHARAVSR
ncbi:hypothetical protein AB1Y20_004762 [Prymnesium parvum]|uniref:Mediator of RNA polymerase II transcription subunit 7 n=1 Tax=Prymnesium parvum TaxID=97485 RepID=A0AB34IX40_PRYPA